MSKRIDLQGQIFGEVLVLEFKEAKNTHAVWNCLCMRCNSLILVSSPNLASGNTKSCTSCGQKKISSGVEQDIYWELKKNSGSISHIARCFNVSRDIVYGIKRSNIEE